MANIYPTNKCFDDALDFISLILQEKSEEREALRHELFLVHAICKMPDGRRYSHAWVEDCKTKTCIFKGILENEASYFARDIKQYYEHIMPLEWTKYTVMQASEQNELHGTFGPWEPRYQALCRDFKMVIK